MKESQISSSLINCQGKILIFKQFQALLNRNFKFQHFLKSSRTRTSPAETELGKNMCAMIMCENCEKCLYVLSGVQKWESNAGDPAQCGDVEDLPIDI